MIGPLLEPVVDWAIRPGPANWLFVVVLLTHPAMWSDRLRAVIRERFGSADS